MTPRLSTQTVIAGLSAAAILLASACANAAIVGSYTPDANTLHLYHLDEAAAPSPDAASGGTNLVGLLFGATLGNVSYNGFASALNTLDGGQDVIAAANKDACLTASAASPPGSVTFPYCDPTTGAFTLEALVWIGFDPAKNLGTTANGGNNRNSICMILTGESGVNANRVFQFRIVPKGVVPGGAGNPATAPQPLLTFENIRMVDGQNQNTIFAAIPITGPDAIVSNNWYHVAVSYNGTPNTANNLKFYWTLLDTNRTAANQIAITSQTNTLNGVDPLGTATTPFVIGNIARNITTAGGNFLGLIDEVRVSKIARDPSDMMFSVTGTMPGVLVPPADAAVVAGDPLALSFIPRGSPPLAYQWRLDGTNLLGATATAFSVAAIQAANTGTYDVVITNAYGAITSAPANVTFRVPRNLTWVGSAGATWDTALVNWDSNGDTVADTAYAERDDVTLDSTGSAAPVVSLASSRSPHSVTVNAATDYTLTAPGGATLGGPSLLLKSGGGTLVLDVDFPSDGASTIQSGTLQLGNYTGRGSPGYGPVTNNGNLLVTRTGALTLTNWLVGAGSLTNNGTNSITVSGTNLLSGPITLNAGTLTLATAQSKGNTTQYTINAAANATGATTLSVGGGVTFGPSITMAFLGTSSSPDYRNGLASNTGTNTFNCTIVMDGSGSVTFGANGAAANSLFVVTTPLINSPAFTGQLLMRGGGNGLLTSQLNVGGKVSKTDGGIWTITSTGNSWVATDVAGGTLRLGANNALPTSLTVNITAATAVLDLAGFNQSVDTLTGPGIIANSSTVADSTFTAHPSSTSLFPGVIKDSVSGGPRKVALTVSSGVLSLQGTNTYTGPTTVSAGTLQLVLNGNISNTASIFLGTGSTLDASTRSDGTFTLNRGQTLKGNGAFNVTGKLASAGTIELKLSKSGATLANDSIAVTGAFTYGGTLLVDLTASPALTTSDSFPLFTAGGGFSGAFVEVIPGPGFGLAWDTSTLATDGTLRVQTSTVPSTPTNIVTSVAGNQLTLSWPQNYTGWRLQAQTNAPGAGLSTNWVYVSGSSLNNVFATSINPAAGSVFYRLVYP